jgi:hypothetical protein
VTRKKKRAKRPARKRVKQPDNNAIVTPTPAPAELTAEQLAFVHAYDANGGNGTRAYREVYPGCSSDVVAASSAWRLLRIEKVSALVAKLQTARFVRMQMTGDEALALTAAAGRADVRELYGDDGKMLPIHLWPDHLARAVTSIRPGPFGDTVTFESRTANRRIVLEATGKLKNPIAGAVTNLARILAGNFDDEPE